MSKILTKLKGLVPSKRKLIQLYSALLFNANLKGFANGKIYTGPLKNICTPGLNCYSCPGASGACPLGSLQGALGASEKRTPYYVIGIIILYGILLGRFICGFLCPFGLIQELLYKIKTPKLKKNRFTRVLSYFKYILLVFLVVIIPVLYGLRNVQLPGFCKYVCPAGTIEGAFGLLSNKVNESNLSMLGPLFTWKFMITVAVVVGSVFIFRVFCRFLCPLGALYGLFNKFAILGIKLDKPKCVDCGLCISKCKMDIREVGDHECINCGECVGVCPTKAISWRGGKVILPPDEIAPITPDMTDDEKADCIEKTEKCNQKLAKRRLITRIVAAVIMVSVLASALIYYNVIDKVDTYESITVLGVGDLCPDLDVQIFDGEGYDNLTFNPTDHSGKIIVVNFWHTQCGPCVAELPYFDRLASEYADDVVFVAISKSLYLDESCEFINENYPDTKILFGADSPIREGAAEDYLYTVYGGSNNMYPMTVILDGEGKIIQSEVGSITYDSMNGLLSFITGR